MGLIRVSLFCHSKFVLVLGKALARNFTNCDAEWTQPAAVKTISKFLEHLKDGKHEKFYQSFVSQSIQASHVKRVTERNTSAEEEKKATKAIVNEYGEQASNKQPFLEVKILKHYFSNLSPQICLQNLRKLCAIHFWGVSKTVAGFINVCFSIYIKMLTSIGRDLISCQLLYYQISLNTAFIVI